MLALSANGILPRADYAVFADTGWEPRAVYQHLDRLEKTIAAPAGIPILRVTAAEWAARQNELPDGADMEELEQGVADGCSPWACRGQTEDAAPTRDDFGLAS
ncbi:hypothetical protein [Streptomyces sp. NPDC090994]|uniref:hypothetical protein n=1 Tax=Streptomyces sp. NPDC090994 TaxID=3365969 RepID=UPI003825CDC8